MMKAARCWNLKTPNFRKSYVDVVNEPSGCLCDFRSRHFNSASSDDSPSSPSCKQLCRRTQQQQPASSVAVPVVDYVLPAPPGTTSTLHNPPYTKPPPYTPPTNCYWLHSTFHPVHGDIATARQFSEPPDLAWPETQPHQRKKKGRSQEFLSRVQNMLCIFSRHHSSMKPQRSGRVTHDLGTFSTDFLKIVQFTLLAAGGPQTGPAGQLRPWEKVGQPNKIRLTKST